MIQLLRRICLFCRWHWSFPDNALVCLARGVHRIGDVARVLGFWDSYLDGGAYKMRTVGAMILRPLVWIIIGIIGFRASKTIR